MSDIENGNVESSQRREKVDENNSEASASTTANASDDMAQESEPVLWVFGYGSLCWNPGFQYRTALTGHIKGYARRFWQGNTKHRGTEEKPGRVATLIEETHGVTWGRAFQFVGDAALPYLQQRECKLGGYSVTKAHFYPTGTHPPIPALVYIALPGNQHWLGDASLDYIAHQVVTTSGPAGHNAEYVLRLARFMREHIPGAWDEHLFSLDRIVRRRATMLKMCLIRLGGDPEQEQQQQGNVTPPNFQFTTRLPEKKLRCLNM